MGKTSILGIEKGKNNELTQYKITVAGPIPPTHANIQFDHLKSEMTFMTEVGEVRDPKNMTQSQKLNQFSVVFDVSIRRLRSLSWNQSQQWRVRWK